MGRKQLLLSFLALAALAMMVTGCEVVGYDVPVVSGSNVWQTVEQVDPVTGDNLLSISTKTRPNTFFAKLLSVFGRPSFTVSCVQGGAYDGELRAVIDWREAVGPPNVGRIVQLRLDGGDASEKTMQTSQSGRQTSWGISRVGLISRIKDASVLAVRTVNSGGNPVTLVFNVTGFDAAFSAFDSSCR